MNDKEVLFKPKPEPPKEKPVEKPVTPESQHERIARESGNTSWKK